MKAILEPIIALAAVIGIVLGGMAYFAKADDLRLVEMRLDQKIVTDQVQQMQARIWILEDRNKGKPCVEWPNQDEKNEYRKLHEQLKQLEHRQMELMKR
jgi:hypothetical protein